MLQPSSGNSSRQPAPQRKIQSAVSIIEPQDRLLREVVKHYEAAAREHSWSFSYMSNEAELSASCLYAWRSGKTRGIFLGRVNQALKPLGLRLTIQKIKK